MLVLTIIMCQQLALKTQLCRTKYCWLSTEEAGGIVRKGCRNSESIPKANNSFDNYLTSPQLSSFFFTPTNAQEIENLISELKPGKACGPCSIPVSLKIARVIPVHKSGSLVTFTNYRPISLLSIFDKIMEKLVHKRLMNYLTKLSTIYEGQFGFRANHSTTHALLLITDKIQCAIDDGHYSCGIFLDLRKKVLTP